MQHYIVEYTLWLNKWVNKNYLPADMPRKAVYRFFAKNDEEARKISKDYIFDGEFEGINRSDFRCYPLLDDTKRITKKGNISLDDLMKEEIEKEKAMQALTAKSK